MFDPDFHPISPSSSHSSNLPDLPEHIETTHSAGGGGGAGAFSSSESDAEIDSPNTRFGGQQDASVIYARVSTRVRPMAKTRTFSEVSLRAPSGEGGGKAFERLISDPCMTGDRALERRLLSDSAMLFPRWGLELADSLMVRRVEEGSRWYFLIWSDPRSHLAQMKPVSSRASFSST